MQQGSPQILINLISNAIKFTDDGNISILVTNEGIKDAVVNAGIKITDTGIGVSKEKLETIFERFQQADDAVTRKYGGTGLGLAIVNDLIQLQKGSIKVESEPGKGTTFSIIIPYTIVTEDGSNFDLKESNAERQSNFEDVKILVVEDNEINRSLIKHLFKNWSLQFDIVNNGREAIEILQTKTYNLILMDIQMPEMDGYTATWHIRNDLKLQIPIIAMTAHALAGEKVKCFSHGMNEYISKPLREGQLHNLISRFVKKNMINKMQAKENDEAPLGRYKLIRLDYMKEISAGNTDYEKTVTGQFIEAIPGDLAALKKAWQNKDIAVLQQLAHNMKTTISVMGLNEKLQPYLDSLENETLSRKSFYENFSSIRLILTTALEEARDFYSTF